MVTAQTGGIECRIKNNVSYRGIDSMTVKDTRFIIPVDFEWLLARETSKELQP